VCTKKKVFFSLIVLFVFVMIKTSTAAKLSPVEELGKKLFFDTNLSTPAGQSCAACHAPEVGWTGPLSAVVVYEGAMKGRFGNRKPPASGYAGGSPLLHQDESGDFVGGMFWDGRATGETLKDPLAEQAGGPFLNPLEQNNADKKAMVLKVKNSDYAALLEQVWKTKKEEWEKDADRIYEHISRSIRPRGRGRRRTTGRAGSRGWRRRRASCPVLPWASARPRSKSRSGLRIRQ